MHHIVCYILESSSISSTKYPDMDLMSTVLVTHYLAQFQQVEC